MLFTIGRQVHAPDLVGLLHECHARVRTFSRLAEEIARRVDLAPEELDDACARVERYFVEALPLHVADEEESLLPPLLEARPDLETALRTMAMQHDAHRARLDAMLRAVRRVRETRGVAADRARLAHAASKLALELDEHLALEESVIFPAVRAALDADAQAKVLDEIRRRRVR